MIIVIDYEQEKNLAKQKLVRSLVHFQDDRERFSAPITTLTMRCRSCSEVFPPNQATMKLFLSEEMCLSMPDWSPFSRLMANTHAKLLLLLGYIV
jgi:hypothetical protein